MTKPLRYAGIGPRLTPPNICTAMTQFAKGMSLHWTLRSGHAAGADQAFEAGSNGNKEIFLPWDTFNNAFANDQDTFVRLATPDIVEIAARHHPAWHRLREPAKLLMCRNVAIILGADLQTPVDCVVTWLPDSKYQGGTRHALKVASTYGIPVFDVRMDEDFQILMTFIKDREPEYA